MIITITGDCQYEDCELPAEYIAKGRGKSGHHLGCYCAVHAAMVESEDGPEYVVECPNCGCGFGVN